MQLEKIISMANKNIELRFLAMVRSLRATGCDLPVWVIPYDDHKFDLPEKCIWWEDKLMLAWLATHKTHQTMRKYQCLLTDNYQFVDADVIFLTDPAKVLTSVNNFVTSCGHWHNPQQTYTGDSIKYFQSKSTVWQKEIFNTGQFACSSKIFDFNTLKKISEDKLYKATCLDFRFHEQPGLNLLVNISGIPVSNLTLPPSNMESTWAGDYPGDYLKYWNSETQKPYLIHWAGCRMDIERPIDELFLQYLTTEEKTRWLNELKEKKIRQNKLPKKILRNMRHLKHAISSINFE